MNFKSLENFIKVTNNYGKYQRKNRSSTKRNGSIKERHVKKLSMEYVGGFIDGEGYIGVRRTKPNLKWRQKNPTYDPTISVGNTHKPIMDLISKQFGGCITVEKPKNGQNWQTFYHFEFDKPSMRKYIDVLIENSIIKKKQMILLKEILDLKLIRPKYGGYSDEELGRFEDIYQKLLKLNKRGL